MLTKILNFNTNLTTVPTLNLHLWSMAATLDRLSVRKNIAYLVCFKCAGRLHFQFVFYAEVCVDVVV